MWDLGWFCADWQYWKKNSANCKQLLRAFFSCFQGQETSLKYFQKYCSVFTKKLHNFFCKNFYFYIFPFIGSKYAKYSQSIVSSGDPSLRDFYIMTLVMTNMMETKQDWNVFQPYRLRKIWHVIDGDSRQKVVGNQKLTCIQKRYFCIPCVVFYRSFR